MYKQNRFQETSINGLKMQKGEPIEVKMRRIMSNKEPITDGAEIIYTDRKDGVLPGYNIRTDRWDAALDAMDIVSKSHLAKREAKVVDIAGGKPLDTAAGSTND